MLDDSLDENNVVKSFIVLSMMDLECVWVPLESEFWVGKDLEIIRSNSLNR